MLIINHIVDDMSSDGSPNSGGRFPACALSRTGEHPLLAGGGE
jgi:hypothetical protein